MAFLTGSDETGSREFTIFPKIFSKYADIDKGDLLKIRGHVEKRLNTYQIIVEKIEELKGDNDE